MLASLFGAIAIIPLWAHLIGVFSTFLAGVLVLLQGSKLIDHKPSAADPGVGTEVARLILNGVSIALYAPAAIVAAYSLGLMEPRRQPVRADAIDLERALFAGGFVLLAAVLFYGGHFLITVIEQRRQNRLIEKMTPWELLEFRRRSEASRLREP